MGHSGIPDESTRGPPVTAAGRAALAAAGLGVAPAGAREAAAGAAAALAPDDAPRGGQMTPSQLLSRHLKSGALGFRFPSRLSHMAPPHLGQLGTAADDSV
jgi:hypothetical protein